MSEELAEKFDGGDAAVRATHERMDFAFRGVKDVIEATIRDHAELSWQFCRLQRHATTMQARIDELADENARLKAADGPSIGFVEERNVWRRRALDAEEKLAKLQSFFQK